MKPSLARSCARQHFVEQAFAHAEGRKHDRLRLADADDVFEHQRGVSQQRTPGVGDHFDIGEQVGRREPAQAPREIQRVGCRQLIAVHHPERIAALDDVDACQRAPGAADRIEGAATAGLELSHVGQIGADNTFGTLQRFVRQVLQRQASERQRDAAADAIAMHVDQFERTAAEIADNAVGIVDAGDDAERGKLRLARPRQDLNLRAADALGLGDEVGTVPGVAAGGGRDGEDAPDLLDATERAEPAERRQRLGDRVLGQEAGALHLAAEPAQRLLVEDGDEAARHRLIDDETNRVRTDVDDGDAGSALARPLHRHDSLM